jgi:SPP1 family predicted phage head-tail adaptor
MTPAPAMINAGKYRHQITVRQVGGDSTRDSFGGRRGVGATVCTIWAEKQDWTGMEVNEANRETASITTKWKTRYRTDLLPKMQIVFESEVYEIINILDFDGTRRELVIESKKVIS